MFNHYFQSVCHGRVILDNGYFMNHEYAPDFCEDMGLSKGTSEFGQCVLKLINEN